ncbi:MAG TPA: hypothetical protein PLB02_08750 [Thermoanaerobaculia bacterium]|nr:hypothetical protein [Thermoanaerobaculia bacterium]HQR67468.1 hypothetical protein [Thermoanaerobaculia bacterium]
MKDPEAPTRCYLCGHAASFPEWEGAEGNRRSPYLVDCEECGNFGITEEAVQRLEIRPQARSGVRFEVFRLRTSATPRPIVDLKIVEHFSMGFTPLPGR